VAIAGGQLDTRLEPDATDPDLEGLTASFNTMVDQIQARIEREARFNSDVSHELRSPLTTLSASLEVLEADRHDLPPRAQRALQLLGDDLRRFQRMVGDLLEMSRADAGSMDVFLEEVDVGELVQRAVANGVRSLGEGAAWPEVVIAPEAESLHVGVDKRRFERVMANLLENAANYGGGATLISVTPLAAVAPVARTGSHAKAGGGGHGSGGGAGGGGHGTGGGGAGGDGGAGPLLDRKAGHGPAGGPSGGPLRNGTRAIVEIAVEDAGPGISPAERTKIFERFYRGSAAGRRGTGTGSGLGLALVAEHLRVMRGEARVESAASGGARFVITLPVFDESDQSDW
jgi:signal transduction histidine kinase